MDFLISYGSTGGKAESIAQLICDEALSKGFSPRIHILNDIELKIKLTNENLLVIVCSTTGDGEPPPNAERFLRKIRKQNFYSLKHLKYAILGLGDTNYTQFCKPSKLIHTRLTELGAQSIYAPAWADDGIGLDITVDPWIEGLWAVLRKELKSSSLSHLKRVKEETPQTTMVDNSNEIGSYDQFLVNQLVEKLGGVTITEERLKMMDSLSPDLELNVPASPPSFLRFEFEDETPDLDSLPYQNGAKIPLASTNVIYKVPILKSRKLTAEGSLKTTYEVTFDISNCDIEYEPGDAFSILCPNPDSEVELLLRRLGIPESQFDCTCRISLLEETTKKTARIPDFTPPVSSLRHLLTTCYDIRTPPKKALLRMLADFTSDNAEKRRLYELCSKQGNDHYNTLIRDGNMSILDVLILFPSTLPPIHRLLEMLPRLQPRPYSASSSPLVTPYAIDIAFNVVIIPAGEGRSFSRKGICTGWFVDVLLQKEGAEVPICIRSNKTFRLKNNEESPIIMVGPGTGVAPFRGFLHHLNFLNTKRKAFLLFGCRNRNLDFLYREELEAFRDSKVLSRLWTSFSREPGNEIKYVQDNLRLNRSEIVRTLLDENGTFYVCGDAQNMAKQVNQVLTACIAEELGISAKDATSKMTDLILNKRYLVDIW